ECVILGGVIGTGGPLAATYAVRPIAFYIHRPCDGAKRRFQTCSGYVPSEYRRASEQIYTILQASAWSLIIGNYFYEADRPIRSRPVFMKPSTEKVPQNGTKFVHVQNN
ncbi:unnamed protein product, partial [Laminaria digitata]